MKMNRVWAMPNLNTFSIKPIRELIERHLIGGNPRNDELWIDPFSRNSPFAQRCITNDLSLDFIADYHLESLEFLAKFKDGSVDGVLFDPPYSVRQVAECYKSVGRQVHMEDTQSSFYGDRKREVARILRPNGKVLCFGWNSGGIGKTLGMELTEILLVPHGGPHNDTICTVEIKTTLF
jgi:hypothetical protein